tara:strand:+ start:530 stop:1930 length:1401 start_codon:yes stop_codon:yes gene_type:complete
MKFLDNLKNYNNKIAVTTEEGKNISYKELLKETDKLKKFLDTKNKSLVFLIGKNNLETIISYISSIHSDHAVALLDEKIDSELLENLIIKYRPDFVISEKNKKIKSQEFSLFSDYYNFKILKNKNSVNKNINKNLLFLISTSGSTGSSKFVRISFENTQNNLLSILKYLPINEKDVTITTLPISYVYGLSIFNTHLYQGARIVLNEKSVIEKRFLNLLEKEKVTSFGGVPYTFSIIDRVHKNKINFDSLKYVTQAGGKMNEKLLKNIMDLFKSNNKKFISMYGAAEATARMSYLDWKYAEDKFGSIGKPIAGGEFSLENNNGQKINETNVEGELIYKGNNVCLGYANHISDLSLGDINKGILKTGDIALKDKDDFFYLKGRKDRYVKIFGLRLNLDELEELVSNYGVENICKFDTENKINILIKENTNNFNLIKYISGKLSLHPNVFSIKKVNQFPMTKNLKIKYK